MLALAGWNAERKRSAKARRSGLLPSLSAASSLSLSPMRKDSSLSPLFKEELSLKMSAKKDAYEALHNGLTQEENQHLQAAAQAMMRSRDAMGASSMIKKPGLRSSTQASKKESFASPVLLSPTRVSYLGATAGAQEGLAKQSRNTSSKSSLRPLRSSLCFDAPP